MSFDRSGNVTLVSAQESIIGFSSGIGAWEQTGPDAASARIVDFNFDLDTGQPRGTVIIEYSFQFGDLVQGKYQTVTGSSSGRQYGPGQDPLAPTEEPARTFGATFEGKRITAQ